MQNSTEFYKDVGFVWDFKKDKTEKHKRDEWFIFKVTSTNKDERVCNGFTLQFTFSRRKPISIYEPENDFDVSVVIKEFESFIIISADKPLNEKIVSFKNIGLAYQQADMSFKTASWKLNDTIIVIKIDDLANYSFVSFLKNFEKVDIRLYRTLYVFNNENFEELYDKYIAPVKFI